MCANARNVNINITPPHHNPMSSEREHPPHLCSLLLYTIYPLLYHTKCACGSFWLLICMSRDRPLSKPFCFPSRMRVVLTRPEIPCLFSSNMCLAFICDAAYHSPIPYLFPRKLCVAGILTRLGFTSDCRFIYVMRPTPPGCQFFFQGKPPRRRGFLGGTAIANFHSCPSQDKGGIQTLKHDRAAPKTTEKCNEIVFSMRSAV